MPKSLALLIGVLFLVPVMGAAAENDGTPTYTEQVAPILQQKCGSCHRADGIGPMSLLSYDAARRHAFTIKSRVEQRIMPPWHLDRTVGIQEYKNDISLTDDEIATIGRWVDAGAPEGDPSKLPPPIAWPTGGEWTLAAEMGRPPDLVVTSSPYSVKPNAQDQWWTPRLEFDGLTEPRWVRASEFKPAYPLGTRVVHHGHAQLIQENADGGRTMRALGRYGVGKPGDIFPEDVGMLIEPGGVVDWNLHYFPIDVPVPDDVVEVGLWFYPKDEVPTYETQGEVRFTADQGGTCPGRATSSSRRTPSRHSRGSTSWTARCSCTASGRTCTCVARSSRSRPSIPTAHARCWPRSTVTAISGRSPICSPTM